MVYQPMFSGEDGLANGPFNHNARLVTKCHSDTNQSNHLRTSSLPLCDKNNIKTCMTTLPKQNSKTVKQKSKTKLQLQRVLIHTCVTTLYVMYAFMPSPTFLVSVMDI